MSLEREDRALRYIQISIARIREDLTADPQALEAEGRRTGRAILWALLTLADAVGQLSEELQNRHPKIPWNQIRGFRNVVAHAYDRIRLEVVKTIVDEDLPELQAVVEQELDRRDKT